MEEFVDHLDGNVALYRLVPRIFSSSLSLVLLCQLFQFIQLPVLVYHLLLVVLVQHQSVDNLRITHRLNELLHAPIVLETPLDNLVFCLLPVKQLRHGIAWQISLLLKYSTGLIPMKFRVVVNAGADTVKECSGIVGVDDFDFLLSNVGGDIVGVVIDVDHVRNVDVEFVKRGFIR